MNVSSFYDGWFFSLNATNSSELIYQNLKGMLVLLLDSYFSEYTDIVSNEWLFQISVWPSGWVCRLWLQKPLIRFTVWFTWTAIFYTCNHFHKLLHLKNFKRHGFSYFRGCHTVGVPSHRSSLIKSIKFNDMPRTHLFGSQ